jgi:hypothetical protein
VGTLETKAVGGQVNPKKTWNDIQKKYKTEVVTKSNHLKFP